LNPGATSVWSLAEKLFAGFVLLFSTGGFIFFVQEGADPADGNRTTQAVWFLLYAVTVVILAGRLRRVLKVAGRSELLWLLLAVIWCSVFWSAAPAITLRRSLSLTGTTLFGVYFACRYSLPEQLGLLAKTLTVACILSVSCALLLPDYGIHIDPYGVFWRGIYVNKNSLGRLMTLSATIMIVTMCARGRRWWLWIGLALACVLLVLSRSATALVSLACLVALLPLYRALSRRSAVALLVLNLAVLLGGAALIWLMGHGELLFSALGKETTLTGRTSLWDAVVEMIGQRPWLGYGFSGFWLGLGGDSVHVVQAVNWIPPHAHNGLLDVWLDIGLVGVVVFLLGFLLGFFRSVVWARAIKTAEGMWPLTYLTFMVLFNVTENTILRQGSIFWILYVSTLLAKPAERTEANAARQPAAVGEPQLAGPSPALARGS